MHDSVLLTIILLSKANDSFGADYLQDLPVDRQE